MSGKKDIWYRRFRNNYTLFYTQHRIIATREFMKENGFNKGKIVLDLGARQGWFNKLFRELNFEKIIAIDIDADALEINDANEKYILNLEWSLPFNDNTFEYIYAAELIEHLDKRKEFLKEIYRILKPSGKLLLTTPNRNSAIAFFDRFIGRFIVNGKWNGHDYSHKYVYDFYEIKELLIEVGFKIIAQESFYLFYGLPIRTKSSLGMCSWILAQK